MTDSTNDKDIPNRRMLKWLRNRFFTGVIIALPLIATIWVITGVVQIVDNNVVRFLPLRWNPKTYIGFDIPGLGLFIAFIILVFLGIIAQNILGNAVIKAGERILARVPVVSPLYRAVKQIVDTMAQQKDRAFKEVCLIEYPRKGLWAIGFITADLKGAPATKLEAGHVCVFVPTTPNPTSGFLLFVKQSDVIILDMTPEEGAKMIISGGMVASNTDLHLQDENGLTSPKVKTPKPPRPPKPPKPPKVVKQPKAKKTKPQKPTPKI